MQFNHYGGEAALLGAELVNLQRPVTAGRVEQVLVAYRITHPRVDLEQATCIASWGTQLARCFGVPAVEQQCATINELMSVAASEPYISLHDGHPHLHYRSMADDVVSRVQAVTVAGLAYLVCFAGGHRLGRCARPGCAIAYVDTSRNGRRRYCSVRCANLSAVHRHRRRHRTPR